MSGFAILDLVIGIIFIYFLLSIMCSAIMEVISNIGNMRARTLGKWFVTNFPEKVMKTDGEKGRTLGKEILSHSLIQNLTKVGRKLSYVPKEEFAAVMLDIIVSQDRQSKKKTSNEPYTGAELMDALKDTKLMPEDMKRILLQYISNTIPDYKNKSAEVISATLDRMEIWYEKAQQRVTGWYKKKTQWILLFVAIVVTLALNVDSISIARYLYQNPTARTALAEAAEQASKDSAMAQMVKKYSTPAAAKMDTVVEKEVIQQGDSAITVVTKKVKAAAVSDSAAIAALNENIKNLDTLYQQLKALQLPIGWPKDGKCWFSLREEETWGSKAAGLLLTIMALSLGTPFWFDLLNKLVNLRGAGPKPNQQKVPPVPPDK